MPENLKPTKRIHPFIEKTASDTLSKTLSTLGAGAILALLAGLVAFIVGLSVWLYIPLGAVVFLLIALGFYIIRRARMLKAPEIPVDVTAELEGLRSEVKRLQKELETQTNAKRQLRGQLAEMEAAKPSENLFVVDDARAVKFKSLANCEVPEAEADSIGFIVDFMYKVDAKAPSSVYIAAKLDIKDENGKRLLRVKEGFWQSDDISSKIYLTRGSIGSLTVAVENRDGLQGYEFGFTQNLGHKFPEPIFRPIEARTVTIEVELVATSAGKVVGNPTFSFRLSKDPKPVFEEIKS